ncbi:MAG: choloylglycine hydrolase family protein [Ruminococcaceae bacterium]|nr:choloylglycine hydrolase family protein [Oscillospiraceae bacterium]
MCTAIHFNNMGHLFGRNLDLEYHYNEAVTVTPRGFDWEFKAPVLKNGQYAMIGMATAVDGYPLYYDAANEKGLSIAGLNFPGNAFYNEPKSDGLNVSPFELIPYLLSQCASVLEALELLKNINLENRNFNEKYPLTPLHWILSDKERSIVIEPLKEGLKIYENPVGVLTNNPRFELQLNNLQNYLNLSNSTPENRYDLPTPLYSKGLGAFGLPGDGSSLSRFVRAAFFKKHSVCDNDTESRINQFFRILSTVAQPKGAITTDDGNYHITVYSSCMDLDSGIYYYSTYENLQITGIDLFAENLDGNEIIGYSIISKPHLKILNRH